MTETLSACCNIDNLVYNEAIRSRSGAKREKGDGAGNSDGIWWTSEEPQDVRLTIRLLRVSIFMIVYKCNKQSQTNNMSPVLLDPPETAASPLHLTVHI